MSWRSTQCGSWFIEDLVSVFMEEAYTMELCNMLALVSTRLGQRQTSAEYTQSFAFEGKIFSSSNIKTVYCMILQNFIYIRQDS